MVFSIIYHKIAKIRVIGKLLMKVLFLDIDGVLCTHNSDNYFEQDDKFDDKACKNLKKIIDETGC